MEFKSKYEAKVPDAKGYVVYTDAENGVWRTLYERQIKLVKTRASQEYLDGIQSLRLTAEAIPQLPDVNARLQALTGWQVYPVAALISHREFFNLLANKQFPAATFIRTREELDYVTEPDIFHELFGHCPMLTEPVYAEFVADYAKMVLTMPEADWPLLQRYFWFTVEFGLINTDQGLRSYGGGILSSNKETVYAVESDVPKRKPYDPVEILRTPYRIDMLQTVYYVIDSYQQLYDFVESDIKGCVAKARELGELPPTFPVDEDNPSVHINAC